MNYAYIAANEPENFTFANLVNRENCLTGESFVSHNIMDYGGGGKLKSETKQLEDPEQLDRRR